MGKFYSHSTYVSHKDFIAIHATEDPKRIEYYYPWVIKIANTFPRESMAIGTLDINDLIQAGNVGLVEAWNKIDWDRIDDSNNAQGELWSFLKIRVKFAIRQEINRHANMIKIPDRDLREASKKMQAHEKILVNVFPKFFDEEIFVPPHEVEPWLSIQLEDLICAELEKVEKSFLNIDILLQFYGIGFDKLSLKELADKYSKDSNAIAQIVRRTRNKLKTNEFENIIENFYEN